MIDDFEAGLSPGWEHKKFKGETAYTVEEAAGSKLLKAVAEGSASGLIFERDFDLEDTPIISWRWKVDKLPEGGDYRARETDDYAARVYVVFPSWNPFATRSINYIWANILERGKSAPNPYWSEARMVAVRSGEDDVGRWVSERRNIREDYIELFGEPPSRPGAVAIMTDSDNTGSTAVGWYDDIRLEPAQSSGN